MPIFADPDAGNVQIPQELLDQEAALDAASGGDVAPPPTAADAAQPANVNVPQARDAQAAAAPEAAPARETAPNPEPARPDPASPAKPEQAAPVAKHTVTGTLESGEEYDVTRGYPACSSRRYSVGQAVRFADGRTSTVGEILSCSWRTTGERFNTGGGDYKHATPVFALQVKDVPEADRYDITIGSGSWKTTGAALAADGWKVELA